MKSKPIIMKQLILLITLLFSAMSIAQSSELVNRTWRCTNLVIGGENIIAPNNYEVENVVLTMLQDNDPSTIDFDTGVCNALFADGNPVIYYDDNNTFVLPELTQTLISCIEGENSFFEHNYFGFYYDNIDIPLSYEVIELTDNLLTITALNGDTAHYQEGLLDSGSLNLFSEDTLWTLTDIRIDGVTIPAPTDDEINPILAKFFFEIDLFLFETTVCTSMLYTDIFEDGPNGFHFENIDTGDPYLCNISDNQDFAVTYFNFFEENIDYEYSTYETNTAVLLAITHPNGDILFYERKVLSVTESQLHLTTVYPNPTSTHITIASKLNTIDRLEVYAITGQLLRTVDNLSTSIDVSELSQGNYFLIIYSGDSFTIKQFIKR